MKIIFLQLTKLRLLIYLSRVRVPKGAFKVLILRAANRGVGAFFFCIFKKP